MGVEMILELVALRKSYRQASGVLDVLKGVSISVKQGEFVSIVGPSGAGKSTLLHILGGLDGPDAGHVILDGVDVYALNEKKRAALRGRSIGFVFQFYHLLPELNALENVYLPGLVLDRNAKVKDLEEKAAVLLEKVGLKARASHKPYQLSGGEQQRVAVARALMNEPKIIFCDEPTGNLDSENGKNIIELLITLNKQNNQTLVIVTHDEYLTKLSHRSIYIRDGLIEDKK